MKSKSRNTSSPLIHRLLIVCTAGLGLLTLLGHLGHTYWMIRLLSHFRVQSFQLCLIPLALALWVRRPRYIILLLLFAGVNYASILPLYYGKTKAPPAELKPIRAMLMNLNAGNGNTAEVTEAIEQYQPDLLLLIEVTPHWAAELKSLESTYPHQLSRPQSDCFGMQLMSKFPLQNERIAHLGGTGFPTLIADIYAHKQLFSIIGAHPVPPVSAAYAQQRNLQLQSLEPLIQSLRHPGLLLGDLNASPWSPAFMRLEEKSGFQNSLKGFGVQPTWPSQSRFLKIPIDHALHAPPIQVLNRMIGPDVGSDHRPVIVDFVVSPSS